MLDLKDRSHEPKLSEISALVGNPVFDQFYQAVCQAYAPVVKIEYSKDTWAKGWNLKLRKGGRPLCVIYPKAGYFTVLVVVGNREREQVERLLPGLSPALREVYAQTREGNGQRWLMVDLRQEDSLYQDVLDLIRIRRESGRLSKNQ